MDGSHHGYLSLPPSYHHERVGEQPVDILFITLTTVHTLRFLLWTLRE